MKPLTFLLSATMLLTGLWSGGSLQGVGLEGIGRSVAWAQEPSIGYVVQRTANYPAGTEEGEIDEPVVVELKFDSDGAIADKRVLSGPEFLQGIAIANALLGEYEDVVDRSIQVVVNFSSRNGGPVWHESFWTGKLERVELSGGFGSWIEERRQQTLRLGGLDMTGEIFEQIKEWARRVAAEAEQSVGFEATKTEAGDSVVSVRFYHSAGQRAPAGSPAEKIDSEQYVRVAGRIQQGNLVHEVPPRYPDLAHDARITGIVILETLIGPDGTVREIHPVTGHPLLVPSAMDAVSQQVYGPTYIDGQAVSTVTTVTVNFSREQDRH